MPWSDPRAHRQFDKRGLADRKQDDLVGGGLIRSAGGWAAVKMLRKANSFQKGDERILGDGEFVDSAISEAGEAYERKYRLKAKGLGLDDIAARAAQIIGIDPDQLWLKGKQPKVVKARSLLCYWATNEPGISQSALSKRLELSPSAVSLAVVRDREFVRKHSCDI